MDLPTLRRLLGDKISDIGAARLPEPFMGLDYVISLCIRLSDAVVNTIDGAPTHTYFHHYRSVNRALDDAVQSAGMLLQNDGFDFFPVAASQSVNDGHISYAGVYSHKQAAVYCGLGFVGINNLFLHRSFGARVRLATLFTDCPITDRQAHKTDKNEYTDCMKCGKCVDACPAKAITENGFDPRLCSEYMKKNYQLIGRGAVCGICMSVCDSRGYFPNKF